MTTTPTETPIPIEQEPLPWDLLAIERCAGCRTPTRWWTRLPERTPGQQVALCPECSRTLRPEQIPTKTEWCDRERSRAVVDRELSTPADVKLPLGVHREGDPVTHRRPHDPPHRRNPDHGP